MSKYFAKYLPVEGEIQNGDKYISKNGAIVTADIPDNYNNPHVSYFDGSKKVKLFLCTNEFNEGDNISSTNDGCFFTATKHHAEKHSSTTLYFKVIGEISADATWVKEGDEIDINDLRLTALNGATLPQFRDIKPEYWSEYMPVRVKCPCRNTYK